MSTRDPYAEPGRVAQEDGKIQFAWPPQGRFAALWERLDAAIPDGDKGTALSLLMEWRRHEATLVGYTDESGDWQDVDWDLVRGWMEGME